MRDELTRFLETLREEEFYCPEDEEWQFRDGSACAICTSSARQVAERFGGLVPGYQSIDNPTARIGLPAFDGHDFALIDDRWLVDYWAWHAAGIAAQPVLDMSSVADRNSTSVLYGPADLWAIVEITPVPSARIALRTSPSSQIHPGRALGHSNRHVEPIQRSLHAHGSEGLGRY